MVQVLLLNFMNPTPKWANLIGGILIVMSCLLGATIVYVFLHMLPRGMDILVPLQFIILPLTAFIVLIVPILAFILTRNKVQG